MESALSLSEGQLASLKTPCYIVDEARLEKNLRVVARIQEQTGCRILLALKGFAMHSLFPLISKYLAGVAASSLHEARLGHEEFKKEVHTYAPAFKDEEFTQILHYSDHISFNSIGQWNHFKQHYAAEILPKACAVRINPQHSEVKTPLYDPCAPFSRLGIPLKQFTTHSADLKGISGLHFHNLCELNSDALERTLKKVRHNFGFYFSNLSWINFGGGHQLTRKDYDLERLIRVLNDFNQIYPLQIYLEPGEAIALHTGVLVTTVLDIIKNQREIAILDTSAAAHMPDVLEMPYRPEVSQAGLPAEKPHTYRLGGLTCLAGDIIGDYSFAQPLRIGDKLMFGDMAHYTMVKNNTFNGVCLPSIYLYNSQSQKLHLVREFNYTDYKNRLS